ncbi:threonine-phosphate decarboxylase CobD [Denitratisoma oestradiolicum]|uniref:threonine-phosphate decarboxylase n=1 Tax=Denitratisoma oestradiolicum TaxID=311182 RepID=A0A6S6XUP1_9PROT|nr:threonine-phosphate decarboxylase CobD [Denitratisoma oestradiolicum]TWO79919.1 threonine-phosphate decarboxylase [Denitratisoma oestradiolicum]CAB1369675.1 Threonine-phosphate decarboxylase [Denitratisoma oestradiolicum]
MIEHGGKLREAARHWGIPLTDWLDLSTGIAPFSYPSPPLPPSCWQRLPEADDGLEAAARACYGLPLDKPILPLPGSQAAIQTLPRLRPPGRVAVLAPTYGEHPAAWRQAGHEILAFAPPQLEAMARQVEVVVLVNPNNPTGACFDRQRLLALAQDMARRGGWLLVDEAFADVIPQQNLIADCGDHLPSLIVLRSLGKFFGLAGARVGFACGPSLLLDRLAAALGPWSLSHPSRYIATLALSDQSWQTGQRQRLIEASARMDRLLADHGFTRRSHTQLFHYLPTPQAPHLHRALAQQGILTRCLESPPALRLGLPGDESQWQRLDAALTHIVPSPPPRMKMRKGKLNAPHPHPRPEAGLPIGSLRSMITLGSGAAFSR